MKVRSHRLTKYLYLWSMLMAWSLPAFKVSATDRPNVVFFLIDDLGWSDIELTGSDFYETPHLNQLASEGVFFQSAYAASPVCSPTRASILTGKYPSRLKLTNHSGATGPWGPNYKLKPPEVAGHMPPEEQTLAEVLRDAGYATAHIGKWHLQAHYQSGQDHYPEANGFDLNIAGHKMGQPGSYHFPYTSERHPSTNVPGLADGKAGDYLTDVLTDQAIRFIEAHRDQPFFLNFWYYTVHTPIQPRADKLEKYRRKAARLGFEKPAVKARPEHLSFSDARQDDAAYAAMVESMDENIGRVLDTLRRLGLEKETLVVFFSDNGGLSTGAGPRAPTSSFPLRAGKAWVYEGGIRVPMIVRLPGKVMAGQMIEEAVISTDIYPTILELAGLPLRHGQHLDGLSLAALVGGKKESLGREAIYFHYPHYHPINTMGPAGAVRMGDFKLIEIYESGKLELYNLRKDLGEQHNLAETLPETTAHMQSMLQQWREESGALMPSKNPDYRAENDWRTKKDKKQ